MEEEIIIDGVLTEDIYDMNDMGTHHLENLMSKEEIIKYFYDNLKPVIKKGIKFKGYPYDGSSLDYIEWLSEDGEIEIDSSDNMAKFIKITSHMEFD